MIWKLENHISRPLLRPLVLANNERSRVLTPIQSDYFQVGPPRRAAFK